MKRTILLIMIPFILFAWFFFVISRKACNMASRAEATSSIPFMHKTHTEKYGIKCIVCHSYEDNGRFRGIPTVGDCTACHARDGATTAKDHLTPRKKSIFDSYKDTDRPWTSWCRQPDLVYFSHLAVMQQKNKDGEPVMKCTSCHGNKGSSIDQRMIKGRMPMGQCMDCHTALKISNACAVCHD